MKGNPSKTKSGNRTKTIAAMVAALGAAIGVNMGDVLAATSDMQNAESRKSAISSQKIKKPDVSTPKVERTLKKRPSSYIDKSGPAGLETRPKVRADKSSSILQKRPDTIGSKLGEK